MARVERRLNVARRSAGALAVVALLAASSCGSDDDAADGDGTEAVETVAPGDSSPVPTDAEDSDAPTSTDSDEPASTDSDGAASTGSDGPATTDAESGGSGGAMDGGEVAGLDEIDPSQPLIWAARTMPRSLNPHLSPFTGGSIPGLTMLHDRLTYTDPRTGELGPMIATEWEANEDGTAIDFTLRQDVTFHDDGSPVDAEAVVANFDYGKALGPAHPESSGYALIDSAEVVDEWTVRYNLAGEYAGAIPELMSGGLGIPVNPTSFDREDDAEYDAGTGPYVVESIRPGQEIVQVPYDGYYDPSAQTVSELTILLVEEDDTLINGIATGQIDAGSVSGTAAVRAEASDLQVVDNVGNTAWAMLINTERTQMEDPRVRTALNMAIDRQAIADGPLQGNCVPTVQPWNEGHPGYNPDYPADYYPYDPEGAKALLAEAGFPDGLSFEIDTYTIPSYTPVAEVMQAQLNQAGFDVTINQLDTANLSPGFRTEKTLDTWFTRTPFGQPPIDSITGYWLPDGQGNPGGLSIPAIDELGAQVLAETDPEAQAALLKDISAAVVEAPSSILIMCHDRSFSIGTDDVVGLDPFSAGYMDFRTMGKRSS